MSVWVDRGSGAVRCLKPTPASLSPRSSLVFENFTEGLAAFWR
jgi:hypothetical protein